MSAWMARKFDPPPETKTAMDFLLLSVPGSALALALALASRSAFGLARTVALPEHAELDNDGVGLRACC